MKDAEMKVTVREIWARWPSCILRWRANRPDKPISRELFLARMKPRRLATDEYLAEYRQKNEEAHRVIWEADRLPRYIEQAIVAARLAECRRVNYYGFHGPVDHVKQYCPAVVLAQLRRERKLPAIEIARWWADCVIKDADAELQHGLAWAQRHIARDRERHAKRVGEVKAVVTHLETRALRKAA